MTCIIALKENNKIYLAADSCVSWGDFSQPTSESKIFGINDIIFGGAGNTRAVQLIKYGVSFPERGINEPAIAYLVNKVATTIFEFFSTYQPLKENNGFPYFSGSLIIIYENEIYEMDNSFSVIPINGNYIAIGSGADYAYGVLYATRFEENPMEPTARINLAMAAAAEYSNAVCAPFNILEIESDEETEPAEEASKSETK